MPRGMIVFDGIGPVVTYMVATTAIKVADAMSDGQRQLEDYARNNAPWQDDTGNARAGLSARVFNDGGEIVIELSHGVDYGYWLELIQEGRFAILLPTIEALGPRIINAASGKVLDTGGASL